MIQAYLAVAGNDTNNNDLRTALTAEGFGLNNEIRNAATTVAPNLATRLQTTHGVPVGFVGRFITAADDARAAHLQAQARHFWVISYLRSNLQSLYSELANSGLTKKQQ